MDTSKLSLILVIITSILMVSFLGSFVWFRKKAMKNSGIINYKKDKRNYSYYLYKIYTKTPVIKRYFGKVLNKLETMYPADQMAIRVKATQEMSVAVGAALSLMLVIAIFARKDFFFVGIGIVLTYVLFTQILNGRIEKLEMKLDEQFSVFLTDVRHYYHDTNDVVDAVYCTLDEVPFEIGLHINKIYQILQSTHTEEEVTKYTDIAPNRFLMMFAAICSTIKEYGDKRLDDGQWLFLRNLNHLKDELNIEILKKRSNNYLFSGLKFVAVAPIFLLKPIEMWATSNMPEMADFYTGGLGTIVMAAVFAVSLLCYQMISNLKDGRVDEMKESVILNKATGFPIIKNILTLEVNRNYTKSLRIGDSLKMVGEDLTPKAFLLKRLIYAVALGLAFNFVAIFAQSQSKSNLINDFQGMYDNSIVPNEEYRTNMENITKDNIRVMKKWDHLDERKEEAVQSIMQEYGMNRTHSEEIVDGIMKRLDKYNNLYYKWYFLIGTALFAVLGFALPWLLLQYQLSIMKMSMEDEVVQFQTIALILMYVDGATLDLLLDWMEKFAFCFKDSVSTCILNLQHSERKALMEMKDNEPFPPFKRFVDNLLSIDKVGIVSAFDEIESERDYYKKKREQDNDMIVHKKASRGKMLAFIPLIIAVGGYMIYPFLSMAIEMMGVMSEAIKQL